MRAIDCYVPTRFPAQHGRSVIDDIREQRGGDHRREEQPERGADGETPCGCENSAQDDVWDGRDGITMFEPIEHAMGEQPGQTRRGEKTYPRMSKAGIGLIAKSGTRNMGDGRAGNNVKYDDHW